MSGLDRYGTYQTHFVLRWDCGYVLNKMLYHRDPAGRPTGVGLLDETLVLFILHAWNASDPPYYPTASSSTCTRFTDFDSTESQFINGRQDMTPLYIPKFS